MMGLEMSPMYTGDTTAATTRMAEEARNIEYFWNRYSMNKRMRF